MSKLKSILPEILHKYESDLLEVWVKEQLSSIGRRADLINDHDLRKESTDFLRLFQEASQKGNLNSYQTAEWRQVVDFLGNLSRSRALAGFSPTETAQFIFSLKIPIFSKMRVELATNAEQLSEELSTTSLLLDQLGLYTTEVYQKSREELIKRQQEDMLELSTPVVKLWDGVLALPMIGTLDSARTQVVMETLLQRIVETGSEVAIIDITGVPHVDTLTAQYLLKTVTAARLMGADCIISGIRPQIAQTIVHLGVDLTSVITKATLADAFQIALARSGKAVVRGGQSSVRGSAAIPSSNPRSSPNYAGTAPGPMMDV